MMRLNVVKFYLHGHPLNFTLAIDDKPMVSPRGNTPPVIAGKVALRFTSLSVVKYNYEAFFIVEMLK